MPQRPDELVAFIALLREEGIKRYLEIGLRRAATFEAVGNALPPGSCMVGVDWPLQSGGRWKPEEQGAVYDAAEKLRLRLEHDVTIVVGNSRHPSTIAAVADFDHFDCVLIDGDHSELGVCSDWYNYAPLSRIVAIHDIDAANHPLMKAKPKKLAPHGVRRFWSEMLTRNYRTIEIIGNEPGMGIGVVWRDAP